MFISLRIRIESLFLFIVIFALPLTASSQMLPWSVDSPIGSIIDGKGQLYTWGTGTYCGISKDSLFTNGIRVSPGLVETPPGCSAWKNIVVNCVAAALVETDSNVEIAVWGEDKALTRLPQVVMRPPEVNSWKGLAESSKGDNSGQIYPVLLGDNNQIYLYHHWFGGTGISFDPYVFNNPNGVTSWKQIAGGAGFLFALSSDGEIYSYGSSYGLLGTGDTTYNPDQFSYHVLKPKEVNHWTAVFKAYAISDSGYLYGWGGFGADIGISQDAPSLILAPTRVTLPQGVKCKGFVGSEQKMLLTTNGDVYMWGPGEYFGEGQTGSNYTPLPHIVSFPPGFGKVRSIGYVNSNFFALSDSGFLVGWGGNGGLLGLRTYDRVNTAVSLGQFYIAPDESSGVRPQSDKSQLNASIAATSKGKYELTGIPDSRNVSVEVFDNLGRVCSRSSFTPGAQIDLHNSPSGIYFVRISDNTDAQLIRLSYTR